MKTPKKTSPNLRKVRTGIEGFDKSTKDGRPRGRTTRLPGKTIMARRTLVNGEWLDNEPGIFVAFEESADRITANAAEVARKQKQMAPDSKEALLEVRLKAVQLEREVIRGEKKTLARLGVNRTAELAQGQNQLHELRRADAV